jgi:NADH dehydrogenase (ubiquinone) 1 alpha subcomplex subunit 5
LGKSQSYVLTLSSRIAEIENKIGAGLIEEVIVVAGNELKLVDTLAESQV